MEFLELEFSPQTMEKRRRELCNEFNLRYEKIRILSKYMSIIEKYNDKRATKKINKIHRCGNKCSYKLKKNFNERFLFNGDTTKKKVALTFDDAPDLKCTPLILDILKKYNVKASFAVVGDYMDGSEGILNRIYKEGHAIINHTKSHINLCKCKEEEIIHEILSNEEKIYKYTGIKTKIMRPPYGNINNRVGDILNNLGYYMAMWSYDTYDWLAMTGEEILYDMPNRIRNGEVILLHSRKGTEATVDALPNLITEIENLGFSMVTIDEMFEIDLYKLN